VTPARSIGRGMHSRVQDLQTIIPLAIKPVRARGLPRSLTRAVHSVRFRFFSLTILFRRHLCVVLVAYVTIHMALLVIHASLLMPHIVGAMTIDAV